MRVLRREAGRGATSNQGVGAPVLSSLLYMLVFAVATSGARPQIGGVPFVAFVAPGLIMMTLLTQSVMNASFGIYFPRFVGTIFEILSAPISAFEIVLGYVGAAVIFYTALRMIYDGAQPLLKLSPAFA